MVVVKKFRICRFLTFILATLMLFSCSVTAFAAENSPEPVNLVNFNSTVTRASGLNKINSAGINGGTLYFDATITKPCRKVLISGTCDSSYKQALIYVYNSSGILYASGSGNLDGSIISLSTSYMPVDTYTVQVIPAFGGYFGVTAYFYEYD